MTAENSPIAIAGSLYKIVQRGQFEGVLVIFRRSRDPASPGHAAIYFAVCRWGRQSVVAELFARAGIFLATFTSNYGL